MLGEDEHVQNPAMATEIAVGEGLVFFSQTSGTEGPRLGSVRLP